MSAISRLFSTRAATALLAAGVSLTSLVPSFAAGAEGDASPTAPVKPATVSIRDRDNALFQAQQYSLLNKAVAIHVMGDKEGNFTPEQVGKVLEKALEKRGVERLRSFPDINPGANNISIMVIINGKFYTDYATGKSDFNLRAITFQMDKIAEQYKKLNSEPAPTETITTASLENH